MRFRPVPLSDRTLLFLHIPKTAGITLSYVLQTQLNTPESIYLITAAEQIETFKKMPRGEREKFRLVQGHFTFGFQKYVAHPYTYITILRDPVDRVISLYYYLINTPGNYLYETLTSKRMTLEDFLRSGISAEPYNFQVRAITGVNNVALRHFGPFAYLKAKRNLQKHFHIVGLTERFDETLVWLNRMLRWGFKSNFFLFEKQNITIAKPQRTELSPRVISLIEEYNQLDIRLYKQASRLFEKGIQKQGECFKAELKIFYMLRDWWKKHPGEEAKLRRYTSRIDQILRYSVDEISLKNHDRML